jgi:hypothetical protein
MHPHWKITSKSFNTQRVGGHRVSKNNRYENMNMIYEHLPTIGNS